MICSPVILIKFKKMDTKSFIFFPLGFFKGVIQNNIITNFKFLMQNVLVNELLTHISLR
jgi:hypothetical protein